MAQNLEQDFLQNRNVGYDHLIADNITELKLLKAKKRECNKQLALLSEPVPAKVSKKSAPKRTYQPKLPKWKQGERSLGQYIYIVGVKGKKFMNELEANGRISVGEASKIISGFKR